MSDHHPNRPARSPRPWLHILLAASALTAATQARADDLDFSDVQACTNAYNQLWFSFESIKSNLRDDPAAQAAAMQDEFVKFLHPKIHFELVNLPLPPDFNTTTDVAINGLGNLVALGAYGVQNFGEHHVAGPFSVKRASSSGDRQNYSMTTRDVSYSHDATAAGGCTVYLGQKDVMCTVRNAGHGNHRKALLTSVVDNVVSTYQIPAPQCGLWIGAPIPTYP